MRYHFNVKRREGTRLDPDGMDLPDEAAASEHALHVMSELMRNANVRTRAWRLAVIDENRGACFEFLVRELRRFHGASNAGIADVS
jgi:hypothetical protein